jgi:hypothetical protein
MDKCEACIFYGNPNIQEWPKKLKIADNIKICGVFFGHNANRKNEENLQQKNNQNC